MNQIFLGLLVILIFIVSFLDIIYRAFFNPELLKRNFKDLGTVIFVGLLLNFIFSFWINAKLSLNFSQEITSPPFLLVIIIGPFIEELIFRGPILILSYFSSQKILFLKIILCLISGVSFGLAHLTNGGIYCTPPVIILISLYGIAWAILTLRTKNILFPFFAHAFSNFLCYLSQII